MKGYKNVSVNEEFLEQFRRVRKEYYKFIPDYSVRSMSDSELCNVALYCVASRMQYEIDQADLFLYSIRRNENEN